jgi:ribonucleoside-diphosphate reductase alpha chain
LVAGVDHIAPDHIRLQVRRRFPDGQLAEVFIHTAKAGSDAADIARDAAVVASLALQHGVSAATLRKALTRGSDGKAAGPIGALLDLLEAAP